MAWAEFSEKQKSLIIIVVGVVLNAAGGFFIYKGFRDYQKEKRKLTAVEKEIRDLRSQCEELAEVAEKLEKIQRELQKLEYMLPPQHRMLELIGTELTKIQEQCDVHVYYRQDLGSVEAGGDYSTQAVEVKVKGTWDRLWKFINSVEEHFAEGVDGKPPPRLVTVDLPKIAMGGRGPRPDVYEVSLRLLTYAAK